MKAAGGFAAAIEDKDRAGFVLGIDEANEITAISLELFVFPQAVGEVFHFAFVIGEAADLFAEDGFDPADLVGVLDEVVRGFAGAINGIDQLQSAVVDISPEGSDEEESKSGGSSNHCEEISIRGGNAKRGDCLS